MTRHFRSHPTQSLLSILVWLGGLVACGGEPGQQQAQLLENPALTGSLGPHLSVASNGDALLSWSASNSREVAVKYARFDGQTWTEPTTIASSDTLFLNWADFAAVSEIADGRLVAHWLQEHPESESAYHAYVASSRDNGASWSRAERLHSDTSATEHGFVSAFPAGDGYGVVWLDGRAYANANRQDPAAALRYAVFNARGQRISSVILDRRVCDCCQTDVASAGDRSYLVYRDRTMLEERDIAFDVFRSGQWRGARKVTPDNWEIDGCPMNGAAIAANGRAVAYTWFTGADDQPRIRLVRSLDRGESFAETVIGSAKKPLGRVDIVMLDGADIVVSWVERIATGAELRAQRYDLHGRTAGYKVIAQVSASTRSGFPQMVRQGKTLLFAWTESRGERTQVRTALLALSALED